MRPRPEIENDRTPPSEAQVSHCWLWDRDASGIISLVGFWILHEVGRDDGHGAVDLRRLSHRYYRHVVAAVVLGAGVMRRCYKS